MAELTARIDALQAEVERTHAWSQASGAPFSKGTRVASRSLLGARPAPALPLP